MTFPQESNIQKSQIRVHPYNVHLLTGQGLSQRPHVSIRWGKNDLITSLIDGLRFVSIIRLVSDQKEIGKNRLILKMQSIFVQIRVHPYNVHWLKGRGISQHLHVSIRRGKNDFITSDFDDVHIVSTIGLPQNK